jgi:hypothetical protein
MAIVEINAYKDYIGLSGTSEDTKLQILIDAVNLSINAYVGRELEEAEYDEIYDGPGTDALCLRNFPIVRGESDLVTVTVAGVELDESADYTEYGWYIQNVNDGIIFNRGCWPSGRDIIQVEYTAGYAVIPADVLLGAYEMTSFYRTITQKTGIASESLGAYSVALMNNLSSMEGDLTIPSIPFQLCLNRYRTNFYPNLVY